MSPSEYEHLLTFLEERFSAVDQRVSAIDQSLSAIDRRVSAIDQRLDALESGVRELRAEILGHFDALYRRLERLEQEYQAVIQALRRIEALLVDERTRREILERDLATLRESVAVLRARIDQLERRLGQS